MVDAAGQRNGSLGLLQYNTIQSPTGVRYLAFQLPRSGLSLFSFGCWSVHAYLFLLYEREPLYGCQSSEGELGKTTGHTSDGIVKMAARAHSYSPALARLCLARPTPFPALGSGPSKGRLYATQTNLGKINPSDRPRHKPVTVFNDDGQVKWGDLSPMEKAARTTQQSINLTLILGGAAATV